MTTSRRDLLKGVIAATAVAVIPASFIPGLTPVVTLGQLATEGKYANAELTIPGDIDDPTREWQFRLNGGLLEDGRFIKEIYAPGDHTGWAVLYIKRTGDHHTGETELVRGRWTIRRVPASA